MPKLLPPPVESLKDIDCRYMCDKKRAPVGCIGKKNFTDFWQDFCDLYCIKLFRKKVNSQKELLYGASTQGMLHGLRNNNTEV